MGFRVLRVSHLKRRRKPENKKRKERTFVFLLAYKSSSISSFILLQVWQAATFRVHFSVSVCKLPNIAVFVFIVKREKK